MKVIIVGNSIASYTLASALLKSADYIDIEVFSDEPEAPYYRTRILSLLDGQSVSTLAMKPALESPRYHLHNVHVDNIDVDTKTVYTSDGGTHDYDVLVLAEHVVILRRGAEVVAEHPFCLPNTFARPTTNIQIFKLSAIIKRRNRTSHC